MIGQRRADPAPTFLALAALVFAFLDRLARTFAALFSRRTSVSAFRAILFGAEIGTNTIAARLSKLASVPAGSTCVHGSLQIAALLIGRDAAGISRRAGEMAGTAILIGVQTSTCALAA